MAVEKAGVVPAAGVGSAAGAGQGLALGRAGELLQGAFQLVEGDRADAYAGLVRAARVIVGPGRRWLVALQERGPLLPLAAQPD